jgi:hypothetical protein
LPLVVLSYFQAWDLLPVNILDIWKIKHWIL